MKNHMDDVLVGSGLLLLTAGVYLAAGWVALLFFCGFVLLIAGVALAIRGGEQRKM